MQNQAYNLLETLKVYYFMNLKEYSSYQNLFFAIILFIFTFLINNEDNINNFNNISNKFFSKLFFFLPKCNTIILEGKRCLKVTGYLTKTDNLFSNRFEAFWYFFHYQIPFPLFL